MKLEFLKQNITTLLSQRNSLAVLSIGLVFSNLLLVVMVFLKTEKTILVPLDLQTPCWVQGTRVSREYLEHLGRDVAMLMLDISPSSFPYKHAAILKHVSPEGYGPLKSQLIKDEEQYTSLQLSTSFKPSEIQADPDSLTVQVKGTLTSYMAQKKVQSSLETLHLKFTHRGGLFLLKSISGGNPHAS